jgi:hypothetical protein
MRSIATSPRSERTLLLMSATIGFLLLILTSLERSRVVVAASQQSPMDLVWQAGSEDPNGLPQNPQWLWQLTSNRRQSDPLPNVTKLCDGFPYNVPNDPSKGVSYGNPPCVSQNVSLDYPYGFHDFICSNFGGNAGKLHGHVDWVPARYDGLLFWKGFTPWYQLGDGDYNFWLVPPNGGGLTTANPESISMEFDSHETINHFDSPWWKQFHQAVDSGKAETMVQRNYAIIIGLVGIDTEHENHSELHPVYAMAIHIKSEVNEDVWAIFARNSGNEGYCSQDQHFLPVQGNQVKLLLPTIPGVSRPELLPSTVFQANDPNVTWSWAPVSHGILFTANLLGPNSRSRLNGELHIKWTAGPTVTGGEHGLSMSYEDLLSLWTVNMMDRSQKEESFETEKTLSRMLRKLPAEQQKQLESNLSGAMAPVAADITIATQVEAGLPRNPLQTLEFVIPPSPKEMPVTFSTRDSEKLQRDRQQAIAICDFKKNHPKFAPELPMEACTKFLDKNRY